MTNLPTKDLISLETGFCCFAACQTATYPIYSDDLVNMPENDCTGDSRNSGLSLPYVRGRHFGISWTDDTPSNCSILSVTIAIQGGFSCAGEFGGTLLNNYSTPSPYRFPADLDYDGDCSCNVLPSPIQVITVLLQTCIRPAV